MPKIIENLREALLAEARRQLAVHGYAGTTVRSVAAACGVGVGTVYNYFPSKDMLIATFMADDWQQTLAGMQQTAKACCNPEAVLRCIYDGLTDFTAAHRALFQDGKARQTFAVVFAKRHSLLRSQLAGLLTPVCTACAKEPTAFLPEFLAEALLSWTTAGSSFEELFRVLCQFFK